MRDVAKGLYRPPPSFRNRGGWCFFDVDDDDDGFVGTERICAYSSGPMVFV